jgi:hypothetical protein
VRWGDQQWMQDSCIARRAIARCVALTAPSYPPLSIGAALLLALRYVRRRRTDMVAMVCLGS